MGSEKTKSTRHRTSIRFINWAWEFEVLKSRSGWTFNLRTHNVIPRDWNIVWPITGQNVRGVQELLEKGQVSIYDEMNGQSLLDVRAS